MAEMNQVCVKDKCTPHTWQRWVLVVAGIFGLIFAAWAVFWPELWICWCGLEHGNREIWMTVGMLNGVLAIGLLLASTNHLRHWPSVLISTIAKIGAIVGFSWATYRHVFPLQTGIVIFINDLIWIPPFLIILWQTLQTYTGASPRKTPYTLEKALSIYKIDDVSILEASKEKTLSIVFLRHFGCTFTRQLLMKLDDLKQTSEEHDTQLVLVHMLESGEEATYLSNEVPRVSDPYCELYRAFDLGKGGIVELFGPRVVFQGIIALFQGCGVGHLAGDALQMPGAFLVKDGKIISAQRSKDIADLPNIEELFKKLTRE